MEHITNNHHNSINGRIAELNKIKKILILQEVYDEVYELDKVISELKIYLLNMNYEHYY